MNKLTFTQKFILENIKEYYAENYEMPTLIELCEILGIKTKSTVCKHLHNLQDKGYIEIQPNKKRGIILK